MRVKVPDTIQQVKVPLGLSAGLVMATFGVYGYLHSTFVSAADFKQYQIRTEKRILDAQRRQLEAEVLKLEVKQHAYPQTFDQVDKAMLHKYKEQLKETNKELRQVEISHER